VRLYGLRMWVEQSRHPRQTRGFAGRSTRCEATRPSDGYSQLVCCAFAFCWYHVSHSSSSTTGELQKPSEPEFSQAQTFLLRQRERGKKSAQEKGCGHRCPGRGRGVRYVAGWSPGSCSGDTGAGGRHCPHLLPCNSCSLGLKEGIPSPSTVLLDPCQQTTRRKYAIGQGQS
jgi:hypothetical protein